jgi:hypothetical protein
MEDMEREEIEQIERQLEHVQSMLAPELQKSMGPALEEVRQALASMRLSATVAGDARVEGPRTIEQRPMESTSYRRQKLGGPCLRCGA